MKNKRWKRNAKRIRGECVKGCYECKFLLTDPWGYDDECQFGFDDGECENIRTLEKVLKGVNLRDEWGDKII